MSGPSLARTSCSARSGGSTAADAGLPSFPQGPRTLREAVEGQASERGDAPFLIVPESGRLLGYRELQAVSHRLAGFLAARRVSPGEVVSFMLPNSVAAIGVFIGAMSGGF